MRTIRRGVFETNSSSTHSISIVSKEEFDKWKNGELLYDRYEKLFLTKDESQELEDQDDLNTYDEYFDDGCLEGFTKKHTTKSGDEIIAFGKYGYDG